MAKLKNRIFCAVLIVLYAISICFPCTLSANADSAKNPKNSTYSEVYEKIEEYLTDAAQKAHIPALSAIIVDKNEVLLSLSVGECSADAPFVLGSVSKSFTALCIKKLCEDGQIDLNAKISTYLTDATDGDKITVLQLLNHTSGLGAHQTLKNYKIKGAQGKHEYANVNYSLLGKIIGTVSGKTFEDYLTENVLQPLEMTKTAVTREKSEENGLVSGYRNVFGFNVKTAPLYPADENGWIQPAAGYISSSANDLGKYLQMYLNGGAEIISEDGVKDMFYNGVEVEEAIPYRYSMGWTLINEPLKEPALRHSGLVETGMSCVYILPESGLGIAVLADYNDFFVGQDMMDRLNWSVALMLMDMEPNEIGSNEFVLRHLMYDLIYLAVFMVAVLSICLLGVFKKRLNRGKFVAKAVIFALLNIVLPTFLLLLPLIIAVTPLWVVYSFVPDMFWTIIISSVLLYLCGLIKIILFLKFKKGK